jgi:hypothetical protein
VNVLEKNLRSLRIEGYETTVHTGLCVEVKSNLSLTSRYTKDDKGVWNTVERDKQTEVRTDGDLT